MGLSPRRFRLQDLDIPRSTGSQVRAVDGFVGFTQPPPNYRADFIDFQPLANAAIQKLTLDQRREEADAALEGERLAEDNAEVLEAISRAVDGATQGLTDPGEIADAQRGALRKLAEEGVVPPQANPAFLVGVARAEAQRALRNLGQTLQANAERFTVLADENGDLAEPSTPDAEEFVAGEFARVFDSPLIRHSRLAREMVTQARDQMTDAFLGDVANRRLREQETRASALRVEQLTEGWTSAGGTDFMGIRALEDPEVDVELVLQSIAAGKDFMRDQEGVPAVHREVMTAIASYVDQNVDESPARVRRVLSRLGDLELIPGLAIDRDTRPEVAVIHRLRAQAEETEDRDLERASRRRRSLDGDLERSYTGQFVFHMKQAPHAPPNQLHEMAMASLEGSQEFQELLVQAEVDELSQAQQGNLRAAGDLAFARAQERSGAQDGFVRAQLKRMSREEEDAALVDAYALEHLSPQGYDEWQESGEGGVWNRIQQLPGFDSRVGSLVDRSALPQGLATATTRRLREAQADFEDGVAALAVRADRAGELDELLASPEVARLRQTYLEQLDGAVQPAEAARTELQSAVGRRDLAAADAALEKLQGLVAPEELRESIRARDEVADLNDRILVNDPIFQLHFREISEQMAGLLEQEGVDAEEAKVLGGEIQRELFFRMREEQARISPLSRREQIGARAEATARVREEIENQRLPEAMREGLAVARREPDDFKRLKDGLTEFEYFTTPVSQGGLTLRATLAAGERFGGPVNVPAVLDRPRSVEGPFERLNTDKLFDRTLGTAGRTKARELADALPGDRKARYDEWAYVQSLGGAFSPEDVLAGKGTILVTGKPGDLSGVRETLEAEGFSFERGPAAPRLGGLTTSPAPILRYSKEVELPELHPTLSLFFKTGQGLKDWLDSTPEEQRRAFYEELGLDTTDLPVADQRFKNRQERLLLRYLPR